MRQSDAGAEGGSWGSGEGSRWMLCVWVNVCGSQRAALALAGPCWSLPFAMFETGLLFLCCVCLNSWPGHLEFSCLPGDVLGSQMLLCFWLVCGSGVQIQASWLHARAFTCSATPQHLSSVVSWVPSSVSAQCLQPLLYSFLFLRKSVFLLFRCLVYFQMTETFLWEEDAKWHSEPFLSPLCVKIGYLVGLLAFNVFSSEICIHFILSLFDFRLGNKNVMTTWLLFLLSSFWECVLSVW